MSKTRSTLDANEAVARVAYRVNEVIAIYPITPSSPMGEFCDAYAAAGIRNIWNTVPKVVEMQSEAGAAGAVHGALQGGSMATTFTASQGLLLMIPNMYKIAGELTPAVFHVAARTLATHALSIFGDHGDVMTVRETGWILLASNSVQEAQDMALIAQATTLGAGLPVVHFFDGFRTSHEVQKIELLDDEDIRSMIDESAVDAHRARGLSPDRPVLRGTAQNPDVFFQAREASNPLYAAVPGIAQAAMDAFAARTGRAYRNYEYCGAPDATRVIVIMGSGAETVHETVDHLNAAGERTGVLKIRLFRPFAVRDFLAALPATVRSIGVLDRTKEPGSAGEPLYQDVLTAVAEAIMEGASPFETAPIIVGGRYGLSSKEFTPSMVKAVFDNLSAERPRNHFTIGIHDDVGHTSLPFDPAYHIEAADVSRAMFYGLGADGTVGANKNSIKIIGDNTDFYAQGYFVYDSKKSGAMTISHLRFGPRPIRSTYLIESANFVGCHQPLFLDRYDMADKLMPGGAFLLNATWEPDEVWAHIPHRLRRQLIERKARLYVIDAGKVARDSGMGRRINVVMQTCFFAVSGVLPREDALEQIRKTIKKTYGRKGPEVVEMNLNAVANTLANLHEVPLPATADGGPEMLPAMAAGAPAFVADVLATIAAGRGDSLPVSKLPADGTFPTGTARYEKRNLAEEIPVWDPDVCIQCGKCVMVCPHAVIRAKIYDPAALPGAPATFKHTAVRDREWAPNVYTIQVAAEDCTGCALCIDVCPAKNKQHPRLKAINMVAQEPLRDAERSNWDFFLGLPEADRSKLNLTKISQQQVQQPLFEFSGACAGCGETPYVKLASQLFGDRMIVANATGCSSIYGGNLPTTPWTVNAEGRGPAWCNSLFEDNAEFGLGIRVALDKQIEFATELVRDLREPIGAELADAILAANQKEESGIHEQRERIVLLKARLAALPDPRATRLLGLADTLVRKSVWIMGGDGWAYDIGFGGLDHVLASGLNVNILVLDTEVYSNTGGQMSKSTPLAAVAKFATNGKLTQKKDLGLIAMSYGNCYVARVAMGARDERTLKAFIEAEAFDGPSLIIAYSHCVAHGINMSTGLRNQKAAVESGQWILYRYNPERAVAGEIPLEIDSRPAKIPVSEYYEMENRFNMLTQSRPEDATRLHQLAKEQNDRRWKFYQSLAGQPE